MKITIASLESFQEAIRQASRVLKCSNASERLELADSMRKGSTCDFFQLQSDDQDDDGGGGGDDDDDDNNEQEETEEIDDNLSNAGDDSG
jgi:hypothetical protein